MADLSLQLQADNFPSDAIEQLLVEGHWAPILKRLWTGENLLLEGCRGVGKTMLMRAAAARMDAEVRLGGRTLGIHATFKRYLATIPPLGAAESSGLGSFKAWVNARILDAVKTQVSKTFPDTKDQLPPEIRNVTWSEVISILETTYRGNEPKVQLEMLKKAGLSEASFLGLQGYTYTTNALQATRSSFGLDLMVLLLDDAAHALDTRAQGEFFTIVKSLYAPGLAFKISVYPAVTRYGLDFSYGHDAVVISLGDIPAVNRMNEFVNLLRKRLEVTEAQSPSNSLIQALLRDHQDWIRLMVYCSNGNPRGLLKLVSQVLTEIGNRDPSLIRYEDIRNATNYVTDRHLDNMIPGIIKDLDPRLLKASELLLDIFREKIKDAPGPMQGTQPRMFLAITNSMQIPYLCTAAIKLLVAANVLTSAGAVRLSKRENGTVYLLHPGFVFRDNVLGAGGRVVTVTADRWLQHFDAMSSRVHAELSKSASIWDEVKREANSEPSGRCMNGHPMMDLTTPCEQCGAVVAPRGPADVLLDKHIDVLELSDGIKQRLLSCGFDTVRKIFEARPEDIDAVPYIGGTRVIMIRSAVEAAIDEYFAG